MTGKELADQLFQAFAQGTPGDDSALADRLDPEIAKLSTDEMYRFVYIAGTRGVDPENSKTKDTFAAFNATIARRPGFTAAIHAMHAAPKPDVWPPATE